MRISNQLFAIGLLILLIAGLPAYGAASPSQVTAESKYPGLFNGALRLAVLDSMPKGELLASEKLKITQEQLDAEIGKTNVRVQEQLKDNSFLILEQMAVQNLLAAEALTWASSRKLDVKDMKENEIILKYSEDLAATITVTAEEVRQFYESNAGMFGGAKLEEMQAQLREYLLNGKKQSFVENHVNNLGKRTKIKVNEAWARSQYAKAIDNPVDKARRSGKPSLLDFGASGCGPCDMMAPILEELKKEYAGVLNVEIINVHEDQILGARYGISSIPVQVFFDKDGKEVYRHTGFFGKDEMLAKFKEMGAIK